jgi:hypothetical protein
MPFMTGDGLARRFPGALFQAQPVLWDGEAYLEIV